MIVGIELHTAFQVHPASQRNLHRIGGRRTDFHRPLGCEQASVAVAGSGQKIRSGDDGLELKRAAGGVHPGTHLHQAAHGSVHGHQRYSDGVRSPIGIASQDAAAQSICGHAGQLKINAIQTRARHHVEPGGGGGIHSPSVELRQVSFVRHARIAACEQRMRGGQRSPAVGEHIIAARRQVADMIFALLIAGGRSVAPERSPVLLIDELGGAHAAAAHGKTLFIDDAPFNRAIGHQRDGDALLVFAIAQFDLVGRGGGEDRLRRIIPLFRRVQPVVARGELAESEAAGGIGDGSQLSGHRSTEHHLGLPQRRLGDGVGYGSFDAACAGRKGRLRRGCLRNASKLRHRGRGQ